MAWNPLNKIKQAFGADAPAADKPTPAEGEAGPEFAELEKSGMMGKFFRHWKNPAFMKQLKSVTAAMQADGVNVKDKGAVKAWLEKNKDAIESGKMPQGGAKQETFRKDGPDVGRNDPCPCGSKKKFKKCCANK
jgi:uncharacterized protein YecA (UPF0149 family)